MTKTISKNSESNQSETAENQSKKIGYSEDELRKIVREVTTDEELNAVSPEVAVEKFLRSKQSEYRQSTLSAYESRLSKFVTWCNEEGIEALDELDGNALNDYRNWCRETGNLATATEKTLQDSIRVFTKFCESIDAVSSGLSEKVISPSVSDDEGARDAMVSHEEAGEILSYLERFEYASLEHVLWVLLAQTGMRMGAARALDREDFNPDVADPYLELQHSPGEDTPLKNGSDGERMVAITESACEVLSDYIETQRPAVTDDYGREPLLATNHGRIGRSTIRKYAYKWSRPCAIGGDCPHGKDIEDCEAANKADAASKCPSSNSPHAVRRGYITHELESGLPKYAVSDRCNVSEEVIDLHYDLRNDEKRMQQRKELLQKIYRENSRYGQDSNGGAN